MNTSEGSSASPILGDPGSRMARLMFYILLAAVLMTLDYRGRYVDQFRATAALAIEPLQLIIEAPFRLGRQLRDDFQDRRALTAQRDELQGLLQESHARLLLQAELVRENAELRDLLEASERQDVDFRTVTLREIDLNPYRHRVMVDRGRRDGLSSGQPVIDANGLVGQIDQVMLHSATVVLLSDPDHALPVKVLRTGLRTIAYGSGRIDELRLSDLPMNVDLEAGDLLLTSGLGGRFPAGLPVARVAEVERPPGDAFALAVARPLSRLDGARHWLVLFTPDVAASPAEDDGLDAAPADPVEADADQESPQEPDEAAAELPGIDPEPAPEEAP